MAWADEVDGYQKAGFSDTEIATEGARVRKEMSDNGFAPNEVDNYFGVKTPDMTPVKNIIQDNLKAAVAEKPEVAHSIWDAIDAGFQMSTADMGFKAIRGKSVTPDMLLPEDASTFYKTASQLGTLAGDLPAMIAGGSVGGAVAGAAGSVIPGAGTAAGITIGSGAGAFALPAAIRQTLMQYYEKGEIQDFQDFWERASSTFIETSKQAVVGGATALVGGKVGATLAGEAGQSLLSKAVGEAALPTATKVATTGSEIATMVTVGKALDGKVPNAQDFVDAALLVGAMHVATGAPAKLREIYAKTGVRPEEVLQEAQSNPVVKQDLLSSGDKIPEIYQKMADAATPEKPAVETTPVEKAPEPIASTQPEEPVVELEKTPEQYILDKIGTKESPPDNRSVKERAKDAYNTFYTNYVDKLDPISRAVKEFGQDPATLMADKNPYKLARMVSDAKAKVQHFFEKGTLDFETLGVTGKSFNDIIEPHKDNLNGLRAFMVSKRAIELEDRGINSGYDASVAKDVVDQGEAKFGKAAKELVGFQNSALKYLKDSGVLSDKTFDSIVEAGQNYVSFKRISEEGTTSGGTRKNPIKAIKGSDLAIQDPFNSMLENTELYISIAEKNRAVNALVDLAKETPGQSLIEKVQTPMKAIKVSKAEMQSTGISDPEALIVFRPADKQLADDEFVAYRDGKREVYKTEPELAQAIKVFDGNAPAQSLAFRLARGITSVKRLGISLAPDFILRNFIRDQVTAGVYTKGGSVPFWDVAVALKDIWTKNDAYYNWLKAGGANGAFLNLNEKYLNENIYDLNAETGNFIDKTWNLVQKPIHFLEMMGQITEQAPRLAEAKRVAAGQTSGPAVFESGFASRESTIDFQRIGAKVSAMNAITAFQNAGIQGVDRTARAVNENPLGVGLRAAAYITVPSILLWWANKDDKRVQDLPQWQRDMFWIYATDSWKKEERPGEADNLPSYLVRVAPDGTKEINKGTLWRAPKPQELGILFGSLAERILDKFFSENPEAFGEFGKTIQNILAPNLIPDVAAPVVEHTFNKSLFTDNKIVPDHLEGLMPQYQYTDYTTDTAKALGKMVMSVPYLGELGPKQTPLGSPMVLENYVRSWTGSMGMYALQLADKALQKAGVTDEPNKPEASLSDMPFIKAFVVRYPSAGTKSIQNFYDTFAENKQYLDTIHALTKQGNMAEAQKLMLDKDNMSRMQDLTGIQEALRNQGHFIQMIYRNPDLKPEEKRQLIDGAYYGMTETAKSGLKMSRDWKKSLESQKADLGK